MKIEYLTEYFQRIEENKGKLPISTYYSLQILVYLFPRITELVQGTWDEIDFEKKVWVIPWYRMKMGRRRINPCQIDHKMYLSDSVIKILSELKKELKEFDRINETKLSDSLYIFPIYDSRNQKIKFQNLPTLNKFLQRTKLREKTTLHGFRSLAVSTLGDAGVSWEVRELMLSHHSNTTYHRSELENDRRNAYLMYSDIVDSYRLKVMQS